MFNPMCQFPEHFIHPDAFKSREIFEDYKNMLSTVVFYNRAELDNYGFMIEKPLDYRLIEDSTNPEYFIFPDLKPGSYTAKINLELPLVGNLNSVFKVTLTGKIYDLTPVNLEDKRTLSLILNKNFRSSLLSATSYLRHNTKITEDTVNPETGRYTLVIEYFMNQDHE